MSETVQLELSNRKQSLSSELGKMDEEIKAWLRYQQGCRCRYRSNILDNLDATHTLIQKVIVPRGVIAINSVKLSAYGHKFRAYESGAAGGGAESIQTSDTQPPAVTSEGPSNNNSGDANNKDGTTAAATGNTGSESSHVHSLFYPQYTWGGAGGWDQHCWQNLPSQGGKIAYVMDNWSGWCRLMCEEGGLPSRPPEQGGAGEYQPSSHSDHSHTLSHTHSCPGILHNHSIIHTHLVPGSSHTHSVTLSNHTHDLVYAIYEEASTTANISLVITDPAGNNHDIGSLGSGEFAKEDLQLKDYFTTIGVYTFTFSADGLARITSIVVCDLVIEPE